jgi:hypothetical protein
LVLFLNKYDQGFTPQKIHFLLSQGVGSAASAPFTIEQVRNYVGRLRKANATTSLDRVLATLQQCAEGDPGFRYATFTEPDLEDTNTTVCRRVTWASGPMINCARRWGRNLTFCDVTYNTNCNRLYLLVACTQDSRASTRLTFLALLDSEDQDSMAWCARTMVQFWGVTPAQIYTDDSCALINAVQQNWAQSHPLLCVWHKEQRLLKGFRDVLAFASSLEDVPAAAGGPVPAVLPDVSPLLSASSSLSSSSSADSNKSGTIGFTAK